MDLTKNTVWVLFNTPYHIANVQSGPISIFFWKFVDLNSGVLLNLNISNYDRICDDVCPHNHLPIFYRKMNEGLIIYSFYILPFTKSVFILASSADSD